MKSKGFKKWFLIIGEILIILGKGVSKGSAVSQVAKKFGISEDDIWKHGGF